MYIITGVIIYSWEGMKERYLAGVCDMVLDRLISITAFFWFGFMGFQFAWYQFLGLDFSFSYFMIFAILFLLVRVSSHHTCDMFLLATLFCCRNLLPAVCRSSDFFCSGSCFPCLFSWSRFYLRCLGSWSPQKFKGLFVMFKVLFVRRSVLVLLWI